jgi:aminoglycoside 3-N-acetyltransferase
LIPLGRLKFDVLKIQHKRLVVRVSSGSIHHRGNRVYTRTDLERSFRKAGVSAGDMLMLHASVRAVGEIAGGPDTIHLALKDALTETGTLFMYAGCPRYVDEVGRGNLTEAEEAEILDKLPPFDARTARSDRSNGALVELFRTWPESKVNDHVARFTAWGSKADHLLSTTPWDYAYGAGSVFERFVALNGKILLLGSDHDNVTFLHYAEHIVDIPGKIVAQFKVPVLENGLRVWKDMEEFDTSRGAHPSWSEHIFAEIVDGFIDARGVKAVRAGDAEAWLLEARPLLEFALADMMKRAGGS